MEQFIAEKLLESPRLAPFRAELEGTPLTFGRITDLMAAHPDDDRLYFVPLILTATDLSRRELTLIASHDPGFSNFEIAKAVRASAGFPVFFRPTEMPAGSPSGCYVDGGVIANYPAWVFSRELRRLLSNTPDYRYVATRPWLNIGLGLASVPGAAGVNTPGGFLRAMYDLARGRVRDQLERALSSPLPHTITVDQPENECGAPQGVLDIHELTSERIRAMFLLGSEFADSKLRGIRFALPDRNGELHGVLGKLVEEINLVFGQRSNDVLRLRANVFVAWQDLLIMRYEINMGEARDRQLVLDWNKGLTGTCYSQRRPHLCNLEILRGWAESEVDAQATQLGMVPWEHLTVPSDRTWLINVPVFDPSDMWFLDEVPERNRSPETSDTVWAELPIDRDGAVIGVLNVDGAVSYGGDGLSGNPETDLTDARIRAILSTLWGYSVAVGRILSHSFGRKEDACPQ